MATVTAHTRRGARRRTFTVLLLTAVALLAGASAQHRPLDDDELEGRAPTPLELQPGVEAAFPRESYAPGEHASLVVFDSARGLRVQIFHSGPDQTRTKSHNEMDGVPV